MTKSALKPYSCIEFRRYRWTYQKEKKTNCGEWHEWVQTFLKVNEGKCCLFWHCIIEFPQTDSTKRIYETRNTKTLRVDHERKCCFSTQLLAGSQLTVTSPWRWVLNSQIIAVGKRRCGNQIGREASSRSRGNIRYVSRLINIFFFLVDHKNTRARGPAPPIRNLNNLNPPPVDEWEGRTTISGNVFF